MEKISIFRAIIASVVILFQWFIYSSLRKYLFQRYDRISRKTSYFVLVALGILNVIAARLVFDADMLASYPETKLWTAVVYFSFLGCVLLLTVVFGLLLLFSRLLDLKNLLVRAFGMMRNNADALQSEKGCLTSFCKEKIRQSALSGECSSTETPQPACSGMLPCPHNEPFKADNSVSEPSRRTFLKWSAATGLVVAAAAAGHGVAEGYQRPLVERFDFFHDMLAGVNQPITVVHATDFHFGLFLGISELEKLVEDLNSIEADALFLTGDVFHSPMSPIELATPILKKLKQRRFGNFAVMGNHDFYAGEWRSAESFKQSGMILLRDQWVTFEDGDCRIHIGGIDDPMVNWLWGSKFPKFDLFIERAPRSKGVRILLSHRPAVFPQATAAGIDLVLAGHIHGGQIVVPTPGEERGVSLANLVSDYTQGWYSNGTSRMYLSRGVGLTFVPWRINCPPEIAVLHLKPTLRKVASGEVVRV